MNAAFKPSPVLAMAAAVCACSGAQVPEPTGFEAITLAAKGPRAPWGKAVADINGDGFDDVIVAGHQPRRFRLAERLRGKLGLEDLARQVGDLVWYEAPLWTPHIVARDQSFRTDVAAADLTGDGALDIVALADSGVWLYAAPDWQAQRVFPGKFHDVSLADVSGDGRLQIVLRNQSLFGHDDGDRVHVLSPADGAWRAETLEVAPGEGLAVTDINADGRPDIVVNERVLINEAAGWRSVVYAQGGWPHVTLAVADFNNDGRADIASAPAEAHGQTARISWFEAPLAGTGAWREHVIAEPVEAVHHALVAADFDRDGHVDLATAAMNQGADPDEVMVLRNRGAGESFERRVVGVDGSHNLQTLDADGDFDIDFVGTNWERANYPGDYPVTLWRNTLAPRAWRRVVIDAARPGMATHILSADLDDDGLNDLVTGGYVYLNPGQLDAPWSRTPLGFPANNALVIHDIDADGQLDVLANSWAGYNTPTLAARLLARLGAADDPWAAQRNSLVLARNKQGRFDATVVIDEMPHDWVHGAALDDTRGELYLSMHAAGSPLYKVVLPGADETSWTLGVASESAQNEALSLADIDGDGRSDVVTGTAWFSPVNGRTTPLYTASLPVDRHRTADINGDGRLDVVVGYEAPDRVAKIAWYERRADGWVEHVIGRLAGPMSLDAGDVDLDGDVDVVVGEHRLRQPERARLVLFENRGGAAPSFRAHRVGVGDEHHDGAHLVDLDGDGDLDIASIGWSHHRVLVYVNPTVQQ